MVFILRLASLSLYWDCVLVCGISSAAEGRRGQGRVRSPRAPEGPLPRDPFTSITPSPRERTHSSEEQMGRVDGARHRNSNSDTNISTSAAAPTSAREINNGRHWPPSFSASVSSHLQNPAAHMQNNGGRPASREGGDRDRDKGSSSQSLFTYTPRSVPTTARKAADPFIEGSGAAETAQSAKDGREVPSSNAAAQHHPVHSMPVISKFSCDSSIHSSL